MAVRRGESANKIFMLEVSCNDMNKPPCKLWPPISPRQASTASGLQLRFRKLAKSKLHLERARKPNKNSLCTFLHPRRSYWSVSFDTFKVLFSSKWFDTEKTICIQLVCNENIVGVFIFQVHALALPIRSAVACYQGCKTANQWEPVGCITLGKSGWRPNSCATPLMPYFGAMTAVWYWNCVGGIA